MKTFLYVVGFVIIAALASLGLGGVHALKVLAATAGILLLVFYLCGCIVSYVITRGEDTDWRRVVAIMASWITLILAIRADAQ
jgi:hypothetical protein